MAENGMLDYEVIKAAVAGEKWAMEKAVEHFKDYIDEQATVEKEQPDGTIRKEIDEDLRQHLVLKLLEAIPQFPLQEPESEEG